MKKSKVAIGIETQILKLVAQLNRKEIKVIDAETQTMMQRAVGVYLANMEEDCPVDGTDYMITLTGNHDELRINLCPLSEKGLAFFKKHRMCPQNMKLAKVEMVDMSKVKI